MCDTFAMMAAQRLILASTTWTAKRLAGVARRIRPCSAPCSAYNARSKPTGAFQTARRQDLRVCNEDFAANTFFGSPMLGRGFVELVAEADRSRVIATLSNASSTHISACLQVGLRREHGDCVEANRVWVRKC